jgi:SAM-dependent methyltransferase
MVCTLTAPWGQWIAAPALARVCKGAFVSKIGISAKGRQWLEALRASQDAQALAVLGLSQDHLDILLEVGFLEVQSATQPPQDLFDTFSGWKSQKGMLIDEVRTASFDRAIAALVRPGDRVVDVGTGSGILAMFAARAGAEKVFALEITKMADWAERLAKTNGLDRMQVLRGDAAQFDAGGPVDLVIGEFAGMWLLEEWRHYAAFVQVRERWLKPGGQVIPAASGLFLSALDSRQLSYERGWGFFDAPVQGFDLSEVLSSGAYRPARYILSAEPKDLIATQQIARFDFRNGTEKDFLFTTETQFLYPSAGMFHGFIGHFTLDLAPGLTLTTGTDGRETHWHQSYFPMPPMQVPAGQAVSARLRSFLSPDMQVLSFGITVAAPGHDLEKQTEHVFTLE